MTMPWRIRLGTVCGGTGSRADGKFVEANRRRLSQVHRGLSRIGRDLDKCMAIRKILARQPVLFGAENDGETSSTIEFPGYKRSKFVESHHRLIRFAMRQRACAQDQRAIANRLCKRRCLFCRCK